MVTESQHWWRVQNNPHEKIWTTLEQLKQSHADRCEGYRNALQLYNNRAYNGLSATELVAQLSLYKVWKLDQARDIKLNVIQSGVDTLCSKICAQDPAIKITTQGGEWSDHTQARQLEQFVDGLFQSTNAYETLADVFRDAALFGDGFAKVFAEHGEIKIERVFPGEVVVDEQAALYGPPRSLFHVKHVSAEVLAAKFPKHKRAIYESALQDPIPTGDGDQVVTTDLVEVCEAWHKRSGPKAKDGLHVICVKGATLLEEKWDCDEWPIRRFQWSKPIVGYFSQGLPEQFSELQNEINKIAQRIQEVMHYYAKVDTYYEEGSIQKSNMTNTSGNLIPVRKGARLPNSGSPGSMPAEVFRYLDSLVNRFYQLSGISQLSAQSLKPAGVESGVALRTMLDTETVRFSELAKRRHTFVVDVADTAIRVASDTFNDENDFEVHYRSEDFLKRIKWSKINLKRDAYVIRTHPANSLPETPAGKLAHVEELMKSGLIDDPAEAKALLNMPDLNRFASLTNAAIDDIDRAIELMLLEGKLVQPEEYQNLELGLKRVTSALLRAQMNGAPEERLDLLREWLANAQELMRPPEPVAPPMPPMPPEAMPPGAMPPPGMEGPPLPPEAMPPEGMIPAPPMA